jgi:hypothetical protein
MIELVWTTQRYWEDVLLPGLQRFYHQRFVPAYIEREARRLAGDMSIPPMPK